MRELAILVLAKEPVPGRVKTRLCPPCTPGEAAALAEAALADTLEAVASSGAGRRLLALDGEIGSWLPAGFEVFAQEGDDLAERLEHAWAASGGPCLQIGMDTPQVSPALLDDCLEALARSRPDEALMGMADDGGWWALGSVAPMRSMFEGVEMSTPSTGACQRERLSDLGLTVHELPALLDVDTASDAIEVGALVPDSRFGRLVSSLELGGRDRPRRSA